MSALNEEEVEWNYHSLGTKKKPPKNQMQSKATTLSNIQSLNLTYLIKYLAKYFGKCSFPLLHLPLYSCLNLQQRLCSRRMAVCVWWKCSCSLWHSGGMEPLLAAAGGGLPSSDQCKYLHPILASLSWRHWSAAKLFPFKTLWPTLWRHQVKKM